MQLSDVKTLNGSNFDDWKESLSMYLPIAQLDLALRVDAPAELTNESTVIEKTYHEKWQNSNRVCLMVIKYNIDKSIRQGIPDKESAKEFLQTVAEKFKKFVKAQKSHYLYLLEHSQYDGVSGVRKQIMTLISYFNKLKYFDLDLRESFLVWFILESLPPQLKILKTSYNFQQGEWTVDQLIVIVCQEDESMRKGNTPSVNYVF
ncbi:uncharacterized protein LOC131170388 [Hevea brasiliensis]|uniref:uncharacterized protein LOC131170388 n=1 Tax=Hevea brasiliensis TaxID=3981 RepID=UPI0025F11942|nr:uncharacterized protein LOC131170388 [Hevea brasiliensis]